MSIRFLTRRRSPAAQAQPVPQSAHQIESGFDASTCRFRLHCTCGTEFDTRYIDEALEWRELHKTLAPLTDQLSA